MTPPGRVLAIDPGARRLGIAVSDPERVIAQPVGAVAAEPAGDLAERLARLAREREAVEMVVGLPRRLDGSSGPEAQSARRLAERLRRVSGLRVTLLDERLTSVAADRALLAAGESRANRRRLTDQVAAALLLQTFLDRRR